MLRLVAIRIGVCFENLRRFYRIFFFKTPHFLRFHLFHTVMIPAAPQETVGEAGIEPGTAA
jgi:hypothetical protein